MVILKQFVGKLKTIKGDEMKRSEKRLKATKSDVLLHQFFHITHKSYCNIKILFFMKTTY